MQMALDVRPLSPAVGAELSRPLSDEVFARIKQAHLDHCVLVFRDQQLTPAQQIAFSRRLGDLHIHMLEQYLMAGHPEIWCCRTSGKAVGRSASRTRDGTGTPT